MVKLEWWLNKELLDKITGEDNPLGPVTTEFTFTPPPPVIGKAVLVHGAFVRNGGRRSVGRLIPALEALGYDCELVGIGFWNVARMYLGRRFKMYQRLASALWNVDLVIGHSFAGVALDQSLRLLPGNVPYYAPSRVLVLFSPSLDDDIDPPRSVVHRFVIHSKHDIVIRFSRWLPFLRLGRMGAVGYTGDSIRNTNLDHTEQVGIEHSSGYFSKRNAPQYAHLAHKLRTEALTWLESSSHS